MPGNRRIGTSCDATDDELLWLREASCLVYQVTANTGKTAMPRLFRAHQIVTDDDGRA